MTVAALAIVAATAGVGLGFLARYIRVPGGPWATRGVDFVAIALVALVARLPAFDDNLGSVIIPYLVAFLVGRVMWPPLPQIAAEDHDETVN